MESRSSGGRLVFMDPGGAGWSGTGETLTGFLAFPSFYLPSLLRGGFGVSKR